MLRLTCVAIIDLSAPGKRVTESYLRRYIVATTSTTEDTKTCSNTSFVAGKSKPAKTIKTIVDSIQALENLQFFSKGSAAAAPDKPLKKSEVNRAIVASEGEEEEEEEEEKEEESTDFAVKIDFLVSASSLKTMTNNPGLKVYIGKANVSFRVTDQRDMVVNEDCLLDIFRERLLAMISAVS